MTFVPRYGQVMTSDCETQDMALLSLPIQQPKLFDDIWETIDDKDDA